MRARERRLPILAEADIVAARQAARELAQELGFSAIDASRVATAVSELTRNIVRYATNGEGEAVICELVANGGRGGLEVQVCDKGPGIADIALVMQDGYTSGSGMGLGLPGTRRLMDEMLIESAPGQGTTVTIRKWKRR